MTITLDLPRELVDKLQSALPEGERDRFARDAIANALAERQQGEDDRLADSLLADLDPEGEPEREAAECRAAVDAELADPQILRGTVTLDEARRRWERSTTSAADRK